MVYGLGLQYGYNMVHGLGLQYGYNMVHGLGLWFMVEVYLLYAGRSS